MTAKVSVVIPTIEEESIFPLIDEIYSMLGKNTEIIVVDKSSDEYYNKLKKTGVTIIRQKDRGVEKAIMMGLKAAKGEILASIDADRTHEARGLLEGVRIVEKGDADIVLGNRMAGLEKGSMSFYLRFGNSFLSWLFSVLYKSKVHDILTGLFVVRHDAFESIAKIEPYRAGIAFFVIELANKGYRIKEIPIKYSKREHGESVLTNSKLGYGFTVASHMVRRIRDYSPLLVFGSLGVIFVLAGVILSIYVLANFLSTGLFTEIGRALISFMLFVVGILSIIAGFILDLLLEIDRKLDR
jgi:dolichol-phosphate mannosyltransferase